MIENELIKKILLSMKYDSSKTLNENEELLLKESTSITWTADRDYDLDTTGPNYTLYKGAIFTSIPDNSWVPKSYDSPHDSYYSKCPGPNCVARGTGYSYMGYPRQLFFTCKPDSCSLYDVTSMAIFDACTVNSTLESKLNAKFCRSAKEIDLSDAYIELSPEMIQSLKVQAADESGKVKTKEVTPKKPEPPKKTQEEINKEILARNDADQVAPRLYASSLGYKDWKQYQEQFCCPTVQENKTEHIKCNQNIAKAMKQGWKPGDGIPEGMRSSYCKGEESISPDDVVIDNGTGTGIEGTGEGTYVNLSDEGSTEGLFAVETDPYFKDLKPEETIWKPEFVGGESKLKTWFDENFLYPKKALRKKQHGVSEISFVVNTDGSLSNFELVRGSGYRELDDYAIELLKTMPNWNPSTKDGVKIQSQVTLPIEFTLPE